MVCPILFAMVIFLHRGGHTGPPLHLHHCHLFQFWGLLMMYRRIASTLFTVVIFLHQGGRTDPPLHLRHCHLFQFWGLLMMYRQIAPTLFTVVIFLHQGGRTGPPLHFVTFLLINWPIVFLREPDQDHFYHRVSRSSEIFRISLLLSLSDPFVHII